MWMAWPTVCVVMMVAGIAASVACAVYYSIVGVRVVRAQRTTPTARDGIALADARVGGWPRVCVVAPAHNEERMIGKLVRSVAAQDYPNARFVLALDRCTDGTERVARGAIATVGGASGAPDRFEIVMIAECPDGWAGKVHAVHRGVKDSKGAQDAEILVFVDADTELDPRCLRATVALMEHRRVDLLSLLSTLTNDAWWERVVQPAAGIELIRRFPLDRLNKAGGKIPFANGQFMMFRRDAYEEIGGHEAVKDELLEDLALAAKIVHHKRDRRLSALMADGMVGCRMYESMAEFRKGWKRIFGESMRRDSARLRGASVRLAIVGCVLPIAAVVTMVAGAMMMVLGGAEVGRWSVAMVIAGASGGVAALWSLGMMYAAQGLGWWWSLAHPIGSMVTAGIQREAARDLDAGKKTEWGGKMYTRERGRGDS